MAREPLLLERLQAWPRRRPLEPLQSALPQTWWPRHLPRRRERLAQAWHLPQVERKPAPTPNLRLNRRPVARTKRPPPGAAGPPMQVARVAPLELVLRRHQGPDRPADRLSSAADADRSDAPPQARLDASPRVPARCSGGATTPGSAALAPRRRACSACRESQTSPRPRAPLSSMMMSWVARRAPTPRRSQVPLRSPQMAWARASTREAGAQNARRTPELRAWTSELAARAPKAACSRTPRPSPPMLRAARPLRAPCPPRLAKPPRPESGAAASSPGLRSLRARARAPCLAARQRLGESSPRRRHNARGSKSPLICTMHALSQPSVQRKG